MKKVTLFWRDKITTGRKAYAVKMLRESYDFVEWRSDSVTLRVPARDTKFVFIAMLSRAFCHRNCSCASDRPREQSRKPWQKPTPSKSSC
jgi:hypothetical protein